jgi:membrane dipeptidase
MQLILVNRLALGFKLFELITVSVTGKNNLFDAHSDIPSKIIQNYGNGVFDESNGTVLEDHFLEDMRSNGIYGRIASIYVNQEYLPEKALSRGLKQAQLLKKEVEQIEDVNIAYDKEDIEKNRSNDDISFIIGMEGIEPLHQDITLLDTFYDLGVRSVGLTHARRNKAGTGPKIFNHQTEVNNSGLSIFGRDLVDKMNDLGIVIDTAHINRNGFWDIIEKSNDPVINSHSICKSLSDHPRNLTNEQIKAIADLGGVIGVNALNVVYNSENADIVDVVRHIDHIVSLVGINHVSIGLDFFDYIYPESDKISKHSGVENLNNDSEVSNLPDALRQNGYKQSDINDILWNNIVNTIGEVTGD